MSNIRKITKKIIIGSANFGLKYGIANQKQLSEAEISKILLHAINHQIYGIDTAPTYGNAQKIIGKFSIKKSKSLKIITKLPPLEYGDKQEVEKEVFKIMSNLGVKKLDHLLLHSYKSYQSYKKIIMPTLLSMVNNKIINSWGVSVYFPSEVEAILSDNFKEFTVEFPCNLFDRRFLSKQLVEKLKSEGCTLFARSVFLQGLLFIKPEQLDPYFNLIKQKIIVLNSLAKQNGLSIAEIALLYIFAQKVFDGVIIGVDSVQQLEQNINALQRTSVYKKIESKLKSLEVIDKKIILPFLWPKLI